MLAVRISTLGEHEMQAIMLGTFFVAAYTWENMLASPKMSVSSWGLGEPFRQCVSAFNSHEVTPKFVIILMMDGISLFQKLSVISLQLHLPLIILSFLHATLCD